MKYISILLILISCTAATSEDQKKRAIRILHDAYLGTNIVLHADSGFNLIKWSTENDSIFIVYPYDSEYVSLLTPQQLIEYDKELKQSINVNSYGLLERENGIEVLLSTASVRAWNIYSDIQTDTVVAIVRVGGPFDELILDKDSLFSENGVQYVRKFLDLD